MCYLILYYFVPAQRSLVAVVATSMSTTASDVPFICYHETRSCVRLSRSLRSTVLDRKSSDGPQNTLALIWTLLDCSESVLLIEYITFIISCSSLRLMPMAPPSIVRPSKLERCLHPVLSPFQVGQVPIYLPG